MILIEPTKICKGIYKYISRNNFADFTFLYDKNYSIYSLEPGCELKNAGRLSSEAQLKHNTVSFHPSDKKAAVILQDSSLAVYDFNADVNKKKSGLCLCCC